ncbi:adenylyl-sulfate kinase [Paenibacillus hexagrammi]|uniref:Adenylyl-sulfate kinase n=1 Tax=Paenibacillus hexagrammi TaxID=2908839 RepID=A0ABY3SQF3_9BACL|nr:adenylyl-sulfate kinase [Paenibacillus sp. YPD9-1]UJF35780.1 adenylyl-sulfate kinase [Paenibacillus sp. YPD9-1]
MKPAHIRWHEASISRETRNVLNGHRSCVLWFTGLSASGKSTLAFELERQLYARHIHAYVLDGDNLRHGINQDLGFSPEDRSENIRRASEVAKLMMDAGFITLLTLISPNREDRALARSKFQEGEFVEIYVDCPIEVCESRDPKGLYKKARAGEIRMFTGVSASYETPLTPEITVSSHLQTLEESVDQIIRYLIDHGYMTL